MRICMTSDLHGALPTVPDCDLLLVGGDYCHDHRDIWWYRSPFRKWLESIRDRGIETVAVAGNHDIPFVKDPTLPRSLPWTYLDDEYTTFKGLKIFGTARQLPFGDGRWVYNTPEEKMEALWASVDADTDIIISHGPPNGIGDGVRRRNGTIENTGSPSFKKRIAEIQPKLVLVGHIHEGMGMYTFGRTTIVNGSRMNELYEPTRQPIVLDFDRILSFWNGENV